MDRALFDAVQQKLTDQWTTRTRVRNAGDHLLTGLLFDDAGYPMAPTHATKAGIRYRYYASRPCLHGEAKTAKVGSVIHGQVVPTPERFETMTPRLSVTPSDLIHRRRINKLRTQFGAGQAAYAICAGYMVMPMKARKFVDHLAPYFERTPYREAAFDGGSRTRKKFPRLNPRLNGNFSLGSLQANSEIFCI
jgi:hypothetical protein